MAINHKCKVHTEELDEEMGKMKADINLIKSKVDDILDKIKPTFTSGDKIKMIIFIVTYTFIAFSFIIRTENKTDRNAETIKELKIEKKETEQKIDKIYELVVQTNQDVAVLKSK